MATTMAAQYQTTTGTLDARLDRLEEIAVKPVPGNVEEFLVLLDDTQSEMSSLEMQQVEGSEERARWNALVESLEKRPQLIAVPARGYPGGMAALRAKHAPATAFWWQADKLRAEHLRNQLIRALILLVVAALIMWGAATLWTYLNPQEPQEEASIFHTLVHLTPLNRILMR